MKRTNEQPITSYSELIDTIDSLKQTSIEQEVQLSESFHNFILTINPVTLLKNSFHAIVEDETIQTNITKTGLQMGSNFFLDKILGRGKSIRGYIRSVLVEKISNAAINKYSGSLFVGLKNIFS